MKFFSETSIKAAPNIYSLQKYSQFQASLEEEGQELSIVSQITMEYNNNLTTDQYAIGGLGIRYDLPAGIVAISGNLTAFFTSLQLQKKARDSKESRLKFRYEKDVNYIEFNMPELKFGQATPGVEGPGGILQEVPYRTHYDDSNEGSALVITLVNDVEDYNLRNL